MNLTIEQVKSLLGEKELAIYLLNTELAKANAKIAELEKQIPSTDFDKFRKTNS